MSKTIDCPSCGSPVAAGRLSCPSCGAIVAAVRGVLRERPGESFPEPVGSGRGADGDGEAAARRSRELAAAAEAGVSGARAHGGA